MRKRILLADDDDSVRGSLRQALEMEGFTVLPARNGTEALALAAASQMDLALLDLNMPVLNGWDTFEQLSREHPLLPVIIVTARPNQLFPALGAGVGALLEKPVDIPFLVQTMNRLLSEPREVRLARLAGRSVEFAYAPSGTTGAGALDKLGPHSAVKPGAGTSTKLGAGGPSSGPAS
ncbi:MAG TPA: response regulator [Candidatus Saccharimonadales bacterium]|nr:response regulator [Candidatus Saccharimonadales bacterium]